MQDFVLIWDWVGFVFRWLHVITAIAWIGSSFYFIALDLGLRRPPGLAAGVTGEEWQVHGGGFYHVTKYSVAPSEMPEHLTWFKWESYATWLSGAALLMVMYWAGAELYLIDPDKLELTVWQAVLISGGSLVVGWVIYDLLCKSRLGQFPTVLMVLLFGVVTAASWGYDQVFTGRAALLHLGAFTATIMSANVFLVIIPNQRIVVADLKAGRTADPEYGRIAKLRSTHNNYLTLPVIFLMLSNHYPLAFASAYNWVIASLVFLIGVVIRHYFNSVHARVGHPHWTWAVAAVIFICIVWLSSLGLPHPEPRHADSSHARHHQFAEVADIVRTRCSACHAAEPAWIGVRRAPGNLHLESDHDIARAARLIYLHAGISRSMPPGNLSAMEPAERALIVSWYRTASSPANLAVFQ